MKIRLQKILQFKLFFGTDKSHPHAFAWFKNFHNSEYEFKYFKNFADKEKFCPPRETDTWSKSSRCTRIYNWLSLVKQHFWRKHIPQDPSNINSSSRYQWRQWNDQPVIWIQWQQTGIGKVTPYLQAYKHTYKECTQGNIQWWIIKHHWYKILT